jgi:hypothetical protein
MGARCLMDAFVVLRTYSTPPNPSSLCLYARAVVSTTMLLATQALVSHGVFSDFTLFNVLFRVFLHE